MKKQVRTLIIITTTVLVLVALLLGLLFLLPKDEDEVSSTIPESSDPSVNLINKNTVDQPVKKVIIKNDKEEFTIAHNDEKQFVVVGYEDLPINTTGIDSLTGSLANLTATRKISDDSSKEADFGLDKPRATATVTYHDDSVISIELGDEAAGDSGSYLRLGNEGEIYLVDSMFVSKLMQQSIVYIGTELIVPPEIKEGDENAQAVMRSMKLSGSFRTGNPLSFSLYENPDDIPLGSTGYFIKTPKIKGTNEAVSAIAQSSSTLSAAQAFIAHPTSAQKKQYGLDKPYSVCEMTLGVQTSAPSGEEDDTITTKYYGTTEHIIRLGKKDKDGNYYAMVDEYNAIYLVPETSVPWVEVGYADIVEKTLFMISIGDVKSISVQANDKKTTFELTHFPDEEDRDKNMVVKVDGKTYSTPEYRSLYQIFISIMRYGETNEKPKGEPVAVFSLKPISKDDPSVTASFYKHSPSLYICKQEDGEIYTVKVNEVQ
ncbi:MAG: DUF4340 domain-containing protein, partial [Oscillospiraceae bacterium]|nr:DUF4340 domain-containing protein [Oscillospiraceae bacterium]